ncbi:hypothetical protein BD779DRAFT_1609766 [Infundibulicybe gibba]|nr:hypothetical protein BD779DRAFT_1609766 [Infundibulicybe gibba]
MRSFLWRWRIFRFLLFSAISTLCLISYFYLKSRPSYALYERLAEQEILRSQTQIKTNPNQRYVFFRQLQGAGFNNQAQEILLFHHLAIQSSRTYIYQPLIWRPRGEKATVPLSAFMLGPTEGTVTSLLFDQLCREDVTHVRLGVDQSEQWEHAKSALRSSARCVVVDDWILNWIYLASPGIHPIWPPYKEYLAKHFKWSEAVQRTAERAHSELNLRSKSHIDGEPYISLHLRRGDFENHCYGLADDGTGFTTWTTLPELRKSVLDPQLDRANKTSIMEHCIPSLQRILSAIDQYARERPHLRTVHILHDGAWDHPTVYLQYYKLAAALTNAARARSAGWPQGPMARITHSAMVPIHWGEADYSVAVDVELARNAEVFIGIGYSSLSTQVIALKLGADHGRAEDIMIL